MSALHPVAVPVVGITRVITAIISYCVLKKAMGITCPLLGLCVGALAGLGLAGRQEETMSGMLIPYEALGITIIVLFLLVPILNVTKRKGQKRPVTKPAMRMRHEPEDPWEKELRTGGNLARGTRAASKAIRG